MLKVAKFGGSSMADAGQYQKIRDIIRSDPSRRVVVVSAAGKRSAGDNKITDLLYLCYAHLQYGVSCDGIYQMIRERYGDIHRELGLRVDLEGVLDRLRSQMEQGISRDELVSRGEYLSALLMADYLGFTFVDAAQWLFFHYDGTIDQEKSYAALRALAKEAAGTPEAAAFLAALPHATYDENNLHGHVHDHAGPSFPSRRSSNRRCFSFIHRTMFQQLLDRKSVV